MFVVKPVQTWERVVRTQRSFVFIFTLFLLPLLGLASLGEGFGLVYWGKLQKGGMHVKMFTVPEAAVFEAAQILLALGIVLLTAGVLKSLGETFHGRHSFTRAFTLVAYGLSPMFLLRLLDAFPLVSPWVSWPVGILLSIAAIYQGVPRVMQPDAPQAFGLFFMSALLLTVTTGLARFVTAWYLEGRFQSLGAFVSG